MPPLAGLGFFFGLVFYKDVSPNGPADRERREHVASRKAVPQSRDRRIPKRHVKRGKQAWCGLDLVRQFLDGGAEVIGGVRRRAGKRRECQGMLAGGNVV